MRLKNKMALITGAGSGIGKETALLFAKEGAHVIVVDNNEEAGSVTVQEIKENKGEASFIKVDVTDEGNVNEMADKIEKDYKSLDILFNNAGISGIGPLHEIELTTWKKVLEVNVTGVFLVSKAIVPLMMKNKAGSIINMSSCIAEIGLANRASYAASKGAVLSLTKSMQVDYAPYNIRVNALMPGTIYTPFVEDYLSKDPNPESAIAKIKERQLSGDLGKPIDVAYAALYLASDESKFMMGSPFMIDGGVVNGKSS
ncbi:SDR family NAD(P)-dependent oxidoreductase [Metabacillus halosaccharovorans]|uniref:SDR family NAD(P)-dependent oxidoreductase n=1 Tax=Metabacillus halosaccharovorans TaxID=930124 RepID=UPI001C1FA6ED|nr:SDR family oxidoreductase [Metabacillus halosaccharovorans]MBU7592662.1 SDR family oxidoreductase [Metabacillus halosaccharovorans]